MSWIDKILPSGVTKDESANRISVPEGLWKKCINVKLFSISQTLSGTPRCVRNVTTI